MSNTSTSWRVEVGVGGMARVLQHGGGVHVEVLAAEHQARPTSPLVRRLWRLGDLHLALTGLAANHASFQERLM